jgi:hypothetical protein
MTACSKLCCGRLYSEQPWGACLVDDVVGDARLREQHVQLARHAARDGVDAKAHVDALLRERRAELRNRVLCICDRESVARHDHDLHATRHVTFHQRDTLMHTLLPRGLVRSEHGNEE